MLLLQVEQDLGDLGDLGVPSSPSSVLSEGPIPGSFREPESSAFPAPTGPPSASWPEPVPTWASFTPQPQSTTPPTLHFSSILISQLAQPAPKAPALTVPVEETPQTSQAHTHWNPETGQGAPGPPRLALFL